MPRWLVTEQMYVDADNEDQAITKTARPAGEHIHLKDRTAERVAPDLEVGMPVRLVSNGHAKVRVPLGSEGVVISTHEFDKVIVAFHTWHEARPKGWWTRQIADTSDLEVVEWWSS